MQGETQASAKVQPYLFFDGRCEEALEFYKTAVGAEVEMMMRFSDSPEPAKAGMCTPGSENKIMHSCFRIGNTQVMASDGRALGKPLFQGFALSLSATDAARRDLAWWQTVSAWVGWWSRYLLKFPNSPSTACSTPRASSCGSVSRKPAT